MTKQHGADAEARAWIARLKSGEATAEDAAAFEQWRRRAPENERALRDALRLWELTGAAVAEVRAPVRTRRQVLVAGAGMLGTATAAYQGAVFLGHAPGLRALWADEATPVGRGSSFDIVDGSGQLDGASAVYRAGTETVRLVEGAMFVDATSRAGGARPLGLRAQALEASLMSGAAEVRIGDRGVEIACAEGVVDVIEPARRQLVAGESLALLDEGTTAATTRSPREIASWRHGILSFTNRRLGDAIADLNRHRRGKVLFGRALLAERLVSGVFHLDRPDEALTHLIAGLSLDDRALPGRIVLLS